MQDLYLAIGVCKTDEPEKRQVECTYFETVADSPSARRWAWEALTGLLTKASAFGASITPRTAARHADAIVKAFFAEGVQVVINMPDGLSYYLTRARVTEQTLDMLTREISVLPNFGRSAATVTALAVKREGQANGLHVL